MTEPLPGFDNVRPLLADELGVTYLASRPGPGPEIALDRQAPAARSPDGRPETAVRLLELTVPGRPARRQFRNACLVATMLNVQPGFLPLLEVDFTPDHHPYLVTEVPSGTLAARLVIGPLPPQIAIGLAAALAKTLATAHASGVLHLDVRPANIVRTAAAPTPLLAHFGISRAVSAAGRTELPVECLIHAARELFGWDTPGPAADVYGLASTLYTMLAGHAPYTAEARLGRAALYQRTLRGGPPPITRPGIPPALTALIAAMMEPNPSSRPTLPEVIDQLGPQTPASTALTAAWPLPPPPQTQPPQTQPPQTQPASAATPPTPAASPRPSTPPAPFSEPAPSPSELSARLMRETPGQDQRAAPPSQPQPLPDAAARPTSGSVQAPATTSTTETTSSTELPRRVPRTPAHPPPIPATPILTAPELSQLAAALASFQLPEVSSASSTATPSSGFPPPATGGLPAPATGESSAPT
ncbi:MAG TPA: protein kinase, partial [Streptosporangiaceae bacterium]|nr:protein kinase [Streptosporangiaceae bacterium]